MPSTTIPIRRKFSFFYDKAAWTKYLDMLAEERYNTLYLWNGHPFTSLLKLPKYPEAQELPTAQLDQNIAMFKWLTAEATGAASGCCRVSTTFIFRTHLRARIIALSLSAPNAEASAYTRYVIRNLCVSIRMPA